MDAACSESGTPMLVEVDGVCSAISISSSTIEAALWATEEAEENLEAETAISLFAFIDLAAVELFSKLESTLALTLASALVLALPVRTDSGDPILTGRADGAGFLEYLARVGCTRVLETITELEALEEGSILIGMSPITGSVVLDFVVAELLACARFKTEDTETSLEIDDLAVKIGSAGGIEVTTFTDSDGSAVL